MLALLPNKMDYRFQIFEESRAQLFKTNNVVSECTVKSLIIKYGIYANIFAEKM